MLYALTKMQIFAYIEDYYRSANGILRFTLQSSLFEIFNTKSLKSTTARGMYGAPYHSVV